MNNELVFWTYLGDGAWNKITVPVYETERQYKVLDGTFNYKKVYKKSDLNKIINLGFGEVMVVTAIDNFDLIERIMWDFLNEKLQRYKNAYENAKTEANMCLSGLESLR